MRRKGVPRRVGLEGPGRAGIRRPLPARPRSTPTSLPSKNREEIAGASCSEQGQRGLRPAGGADRRRALSGAGALHPAPLHRPKVDGPPAGHGRPAGRDRPAGIRARKIPCSSTSLKPIQMFQAMMDEIEQDVVHATLSVRRSPAKVDRPDPGPPRRLAGRRRPASARRTTTGVLQAEAAGARASSGGCDEGGAQRSLPLRQRQEVQEVPRCRRAASEPRFSDRIWRGSGNVR